MDYDPEEAFESDFRIETEKKILEMKEAGFISNDDFVRFGPPGISRMFLKEELLGDSRPHRYPQDVKNDGEGDPDLVKEKYQEFKNS